MRTALMLALLLPWVVKCATPQDSSSNKSIHVTFAVDGETVPCGETLVRLSFRGRTIAPQSSSHGFVVPAIFDKKTSSSSEGKEEKVDVDFVCGEYALHFQLPASFVTPGSWEFGIEYPPHWIESFRREADVAQGTWISYVTSTCNNCDPGVVTWLSHSDPPLSLVTRLQQEQATASGGRARNIAYALAVFSINYQENRNYVVQLLDSCIPKANESQTEDDVCDGRLLDYVVNLYWRGDRVLLDYLLGIAASRDYVIKDIGTFYADLLDGRPAAILHAMQDMPVEKQLAICRLAGEFDLWLDGPKLERVAKNLRSAGGELANRCLNEAEKAAKHGSPP